MQDVLRAERSRWSDFWERVEMIGVPVVEVPAEGYAKLLDQMFKHQLKAELELFHVKTGRPAPGFISSEAYDDEPMDINTVIRLSDLRVSFYVFHYNFMREIEFTADEILRVIEEPVKGGIITPRKWTPEGWRIPQ